MTEIPSSPVPQLHGMRILIVEDEPLVAMLVEEYVMELGCVVAASARKIGPALDAASNEKIDAAILDMNIAGSPVTPVAEALSLRNIPFVFASGYGKEGIESQWSDRPVLKKPFTSIELRAALVAILYP